MRIIIDIDDHDYEEIKEDAEKFRSKGMTVPYLYKVIESGTPIIEANKEYEVEIINRGNCMMCGKELDEGLFFCKECETKAESEG